MNIGQMLAREKQNAERKQLAALINDVNRAQAELRQQRADFEEKGLCSICFGSGEYLFSEGKCRSCGGTGKSKTAVNGAPA